MKWKSPPQGLVPAEVSLLDMLFVKLIGSYSDVVCSWPLGVLVLGPLGWDSGSDQCQMLPVTGPGQPV